VRKGASLLLAQALNILAAYDRCECWDKAAEEMKGSKVGPSSSAH
jgi:hypothetical protein